MAKKRELVYEVSKDGSYIIGTLRNGTKFLIDIDDLEKVRAHTWYLSHYGYINTRINGKYVFLHRLIMDAPTGLQVDHINLDKSDNRKSNLRFVTHKENKQNAGLRKDNTTGAKGVCYLKQRNKYISYVYVDGKRIYLGSYLSLLEASQAYDKAALYYFGEYARPNNFGKKAQEATLLFCSSTSIYNPPTSTKVTFFS
jgi:hypothetical protein